MHPYILLISLEIFFILLIVYEQCLNFQLVLEK